MGGAAGVAACSVLTTTSLLFHERTLVGNRPALPLKWAAGPFGRAGQFRARALWMAMQPPLLENHSIPGPACRYPQVRSAYTGLLPAQPPCSARCCNQIRLHGISHQSQPAVLAHSESRRLPTAGPTHQFLVVLPSTPT